MLFGIAMWSGSVAASIPCIFNWAIPPSTINQAKTALVVNVEYVVQNMETMFRQVNINVMGGCV
jgi:hypothetical protein